MPMQRRAGGLHTLTPTSAKASSSATMLTQPLQSMAEMMHVKFSPSTLAGSHVMHTQYSTV